MKRILAVGLLIVLIGHQSIAQEKNENRGAGYIFVAPGAAVASGDFAGLLHFGVGGQGLLYKGLGMGGEIGYITTTTSIRNGVGLLSINGQYQFGRAGHGRKPIPFITAGYSMAFRGGIFNAVNFGAGLNYWIGKKKALLLEVRDYVALQSPDVHVLTGRIGMSFR